MITLFIDTSSADVSIAVLKSEVILSSVTKNIPNKHSVYTVRFIEECLEQANVTPKDVKRIMVVVGPGSFTGLRIGVTIAKVYSYIEGAQVIPVSSLKMRALSVSHDYCLSLIDAHHSHYYIGLYDKDNHEVVKEHFSCKEEVLKLIDKYHPFIVSDCSGNIDDISYSKQELDIGKIVEYYQDMESVNPHLVNPNYLKLPQALEDLHD